MRAYISGPMTGIDGHNYGAFAALCRKLREAGYEVFDPTELFGGRTDLPWEHYMKSCLTGVFSCQRVFVLDGWRQSVGARVEVAAAMSSAIPVYEYNHELDDWYEIPFGRDAVGELIGLTVNKI